MAKVKGEARRATPEDVDALVGLCLEARGESPISAQSCTSSAEVLAQHLRGALQMEDMRLLVAEHDGRPVGLGLVRLVRPGLLSEIGWLQVEAIYVSADHRRRGAGHALMTAIGHLAAADQAERVVTMPLAGARSEQRFLSRLGFVPAGPHRVAETASLVRRLDLELVPRERRRNRGLEHLIAARRRDRQMLPESTTGGDVPLAAG